jgi:hypothetical protein
MPIYPVLSNYCGPNDYVDGGHNKHCLLYGTYVVFRTTPGRTNMSHEPRAEGWLGTTNDWSETALGEFPDTAAAMAAVRDRITYVKELIEESDEEEPYYEVDDTEDGNVVQIPRFYVRPIGINSVWDAGDWLDGCKSECRDHIRNQGLDSVVDNFTQLAAADGIHLTGLRDWLEDLAEDDKGE